MLTVLQALVKSLCVLLEQERKEYEEQQRQVRQEIEEVLGEQGILEDMEQCGLGVSLGRQEALKKLLEEYKELEIKLVSLKDEHQAAMREAKEAHANALNEATVLTAELER